MNSVAADPSPLKDIYDGVCVYCLNADAECTCVGDAILAEAYPAEPTITETELPKRSKCVVVSRDNLEIAARMTCVYQDAWSVLVLGEWQIVRRTIRRSNPTTSRK